MQIPASETVSGAGKIIQLCTAKYKICKTVSVHSGCYNKTVLSWMVYKQQTYFSILDAAESKGMVLTDLLSAESPCPH